jgi:hypothetical protein
MNVWREPHRPVCISTISTRFHSAAYFCTKIELALAQRARLRGKGRLRRKPQGTCARSGFDGSARARH